MFHHTMFFYSKLWIQQSAEIYLWHKLLFCHLPTISSLLFPPFAVTYVTTSQKYNCGLCFFAPVTHSNGQWETLQRVQKVMSVGCNYRDANLWRPKIGRLYFFYSPPEFQRPPPPRNGNDWGIIWRVTWCTYYRNSNARKNLCQWQKCPRNHTANKKNSSFELKMG